MQTTLGAVEAALVGDSGETETGLAGSANEPEFCEPVCASTDAGLRRAFRNLAEQTSFGVLS